MFRFRLAALLKYREHQRDLCRQILANVLAEEQRVRERLAQSLSARGEVFEEIRSVGDQPQVRVDRLASRRFYAGVLAAQRAQAEQELLLIGQQLELCRQALVRADQGVKAIERLRQDQLQTWNADQERKQSRQREELWQAGRQMRGER